ncbi:MAG TPA: hypothetical protein VK195_02870, partial [Burkholderiaceae bacterium]|nr:hypothetical protein [Burkholderiaceae bacterium]
MPVFELKSPDGKSYEVDAPDASSAARALQQMVAPQTVDSTLMGYGRAAAEGLKSGTVGLYNLGNDLASRAEDTVGGWMGITPDQMGAMREGRAAAGVGTPRTSDYAMQRADEVIPHYDPRTRGEKYARTMGEFVPGMMLGPGTASQKVISGVTSALGSEAAGQATEGSWLEPFARIGGAVAGGMVPGAVRRVVNPFPVSADRAKNIRTLRNEGVPMTAGQATGRKGLGYLESELGGGKAAQIMDDQAEQFTRAAAAKAGIKATHLSPDVMNKAFDDIGAVFDDLATRTQVPMDAQMQDDLLNAVTDY